MIAMPAPTTERIMLMLLGVQVTKLRVGELRLHTDGVGQTGDDTGRSTEHADGGIDAAITPITEPPGGMSST